MPAENRAVVEEIAKGVVTCFPRYPPTRNQRLGKCLC